MIDCLPWMEGSDLRTASIFNSLEPPVPSTPSLALTMVPKTVALEACTSALSGNPCVGQRSHAGETAWRASRSTQTNSIREIDMGLLLLMWRHVSNVPFHPRHFGNVPPHDRYLP